MLSSIFSTIFEATPLIFSSSACVGNGMVHPLSLVLTGFSGFSAGAFRVPICRATAGSPLVSGSGAFSFLAVNLVEILFPVLGNGVRILTDTDRTALLLERNWGRKQLQVISKQQKVL
jgi:hypothetical protein